MAEPSPTRPAKESRKRLPPGASSHPKAGPYSPVLRVSCGEMVVISGQGPLDEQGRIVGETIEEQTRLTIENCRKQLEAGGATLDDVFKTTVYLKDMEEWGRFNAVYREYFSPPYPVRTTSQAVLWGGIKIEIDMMASV